MKFSRDNSRLIRIFCANSRWAWASISNSLRADANSACNVLFDHTMSTQPTFYFKAKHYPTSSRPSSSFACFISFLPISSCKEALNSWCYNHRNITDLVHALTLCYTTAWGLRRSFWPRSFCASVLHNRHRLGPFLQKFPTALCVS